MSIVQETLYDRLEREEAEALGAYSKARNQEGIGEDDDADEESDNEADPTGPSSGRKGRVKGVGFETLLGELVFSKELEKYFKLVDKESASKAPKTRAQRREDEVSHGRLLMKYAELAENSKSQYLAALRLYKVRAVDAMLWRISQYAMEELTRIVCGYV